MASNSDNTADRIPSLPLQLSVLFIAGRKENPAWLRSALSVDTAVNVRLDAVTGLSNGLIRLRDDTYDAVLLSHGPPEIDAPHVLDAIRAGCSDELPILVLGQESAADMVTYCYEAGADAYLCLPETTTRALLWEMSRATERHRLIQDNRRLQQACQHRLQLDHNEASSLLQQQRAMIADLQQLCDKQDADENFAALSTTGRPTADEGGRRHLPPVLSQKYRELLRAYVIMGSGNLADEMQQLGELLATASITAQDLMLLHLSVLEEMIRGLGSRSAKHVLNRADLLILEVMIHLADGYRSQVLVASPPDTRESRPSISHTSSSQGGGQTGHGPHTLAGPHARPAKSEHRKVVPVRRSQVSGKDPVI